MGSYLVNPVTQKPFSQQSAPSGTTILPGFAALVPSNLGAAALNAPDGPADKTCFAVVDSGQQSGTNPITVSGNGSLIDGAASVVLQADAIEAVFVFDTSFNMWRRLLPVRQFDDDPPTPVSPVETPSGSPSGFTIPIVVGSAVPRILIAGVKTLLGSTATEGYLFTDPAFTAGLQAAIGRIYPLSALYMGLGAVNAFGLDADGVGIGLSGQNAWFHARPASYQGMTAGLFRGFVTATPVGNPAAGVYDFVESTDGGLPVFRRTNGEQLLVDLPNPSIMGLRLTLSSGVPVVNGNVSNATTIYLTPYESGCIALYDGARWRLRITDEISAALGTLVANTNHDVFAFWTGSAVSLEFTAWTNDTTRATALVRQNGILVRSGAPTRRYVGTFRTTSTTQTQDTQTQRFLWNFYNRVERTLVRADPAVTWTYALTTIRQANATAANRVEVVVGFNCPVSAEVNAIQQGTASAGLAGVVGIGIDQTTVFDAVAVAGFSVNNEFASGSNLTTANYDSTLTPGYHAINWLERCSAAALVTFTGTNAPLGVTSTLRARLAA